MEYSKRPIDIPEQISILTSRGLVIDSESFARLQFSNISYFRLASYWKPFEVDSDTHDLEKGTSLNDVLSLYVFDRELRGIIFAAIQDVEIALRTRIIHYFSMKHGAFWFMDASLFSDAEIFNKCFSSLQNEVGRSKEDFLLEHFKKYDSPSMPPVWKTLEVASFGTLSKLFCNMMDVSVKKSVAKSFGLPQYKYLESWIRSITVLRNCCAHHARIWNRRFPLMPQLPRRLSLAWIDAEMAKPMKLYAQLSTILYLEQSIVSNSSIKEQLQVLLSKQPLSKLKAMGFPENWSKQGLWS
ncbi:Abortive infection bacteriophage resistance protein [Fibrobacter sp. UWOV1]|uniref:Abi family protein n=1 Tax=Fibrobacter sp. UWOV1 TaxID=1896215 RepID=UPI00091D149A|nr:Abi family protein [Fibrobacter sp. UWOV1]SHL37486.1 Abortive infection bacteriophage resistance protein [Fibrobacter sp. UWOV1]